MPVRLSASRIKTAQDCSWKYYTTYILKLSDGGNSGSGRGSVCHPILEALLRPDRKPYFDRILKEKNVYCIPSIKRMVDTLARRENVFDSENLHLINEFILTALNLDFYCEGAEKVISELKFEEKDDKIWSLGFVDKLAIYPDKIKIIDYKTQKNFFTDEELRFNVQVLMYVMVAKKMFPGKKIEFEFHQLKEALVGRGLKKVALDPIQTIQQECITDEIIEGFRQWLIEFSEFLSDFDLEKAHSNFAKNDFLKSRTRCGGELGQRRKSDGGLMFTCPSKYPKVYFALCQGEDVIKTADSRQELEKHRQEGQRIEQKSYAGCPAWKHLWQNKS